MSASPTSPFMTSSGHNQTDLLRMSAYSIGPFIPQVISGSVSRGFTFTVYRITEECKYIFVITWEHEFFISAVVAQSYKPEVEVMRGVSRGCTAVLRCVVPSHAKDLVRVVSWLQEPSFHIYPSLQGGELSSGETWFIRVAEYFQ